MAHNPKRLSRLRAVMGEQGIDVLYVCELSNISWATGFERVFDDEPAHALVVSAHNCVLHTDSRYFDAMKSAAADTDIEVDNSRMAHSAVLAQVSDCSTAISFVLALRIRCLWRNIAPCSERLRAGQSIWWNFRAL